MNATILLDEIDLPDSGPVEIEVKRSFTIGISATQARRRVNGWLALHVSTSMLGDEPSLVVADRVVWRVPILYTATHVGPVGTIGAADVDVESGEVLPETADIEEMYCRIEELAKTLPPFKLREVPEKYLAKDLESVPVAQPSWQSITEIFPDITEL